MKSDSNDLVSTISPKYRSHQVSSRFMSPSSTGPLEPNSASSIDSQRGKLWPKRNMGTLADYIGKDRLRDKEEHDLHNGQNQKPMKTTAKSSDFSALRKQRSCREFNNSEHNNNSSFQGKSSFSRSSSVKKIGSSEGDLSTGDSMMVKKLMTQKVFKKANSLTRYMSSKSQWALSPGRSGSPPMSVGNKEKPLYFSSLRPQNKGLEKILNMGFDLFRSKKSSTTNSEAVHHLRLLHNRLLQWRFANAKAQVVNDNIIRQAESNLIYALDGITKLQCSVLQKRIQLERERLEMKLNFVLHSQMKLLETWGDMERQHLAAITTMKECLHSVVSKVPLLEGAKVDIQLAYIAQRHASDLTDSIKSMLSSFSPSADKIVELLSELAKVVAQEKLLLDEFNDLSRTICFLELKERSLMCSLIQLAC